MSRAFRAASAAQRVIDAAKSRLAPHAPGQSPATLALSSVRAAINETVKSRNGYQAWSLYTALRQGDIQITTADIDSLAGAMLHVDHELHSKLAARRTLSILDAVRQEGLTPSRTLLQHAAAACALGGLADLAEALCEEAEDTLETPQSFDMRMRNSFIRACGAANQLERAFEAYRALERDTGCHPPSAGSVVSLFKACVSARDLDAAFAFLDELSRSGFQVGAGSIAQLLSGCAQMGDVDRAKALLALATKVDVDVRSAAVREFARAGGPFLALACELHRQAAVDGGAMPTASTSKLVRACLAEGYSDVAAELLGVPSKDEGAISELSDAFDLLHSITRQQIQHEEHQRDRWHGDVNTTSGAAPNTKAATDAFADDIEARPRASLMDEPPLWP
jgi:pentatricopeptide repeat protein